jgi:hypothetical protein
MPVASQGRLVYTMRFFFAIEFSPKSGWALDFRNEQGFPIS